MQKILYTNQVTFRQAINKNNDIRFNLFYEDNPNLNLRSQYKDTKDGRFIYYHYR